MQAPESVRRDARPLSTLSETEHCHPKNQVKITRPPQAPCGPGRAGGVPKGVPGPGWDGVQAGPTARVTANTGRNGRVCTCDSHDAGILRLPAWNHFCREAGPWARTLWQSLNCTVFTTISFFFLWLEFLVTTKMRLSLLRFSQLLLKNKRFVLVEVYLLSAGFMFRRPVTPRVNRKTLSSYCETLQA